MAPTDAIWLFSGLTEFWLLACLSSPCISACGIGYASEKYLKWWTIQLNNYRVVNNCMQASVFLAEIQHFKQLQLVSLKFYAWSHRYKLWDIEVGIKR